MKSPETDKKDYSDWLPDSGFRKIKAEEEEEASDNSDTSADSQKSENSDAALEAITTKVPISTVSNRIKTEESGASQDLNNIKTKKIKTESEQEDVKIPIKTETKREAKVTANLNTNSVAKPKLQDVDVNKYIRMPTVFDAVAGRVGRGLPPLYDFSKLPPGQLADHLKKVSRTKPITASFTKPLTADEVLFEDSRAPKRYEEYDIYFANERELPHGGHGVLPHSDALKAIHEYTSSFYEQPGDPFSTVQGESRSGSFRSMDETALIAFGILMEESARNLLGRKGHQAFVANENSDSDSEDSFVAVTSAATVSSSGPSPTVPAQVKPDMSKKSDVDDVVDLSRIRPWQEESKPSGSSRKKAKKRKVGGLQSLGSQDKRLTKGFKTR